MGFLRESDQKRPPPQTPVTWLRHSPMPTRLCSILRAPPSSPLPHLPPLATPCSHLCHLPRLAPPFSPFSPPVSAGPTLFTFVPACLLMAPPFSPFSRLSLLAPPFSLFSPPVSAGPALSACMRPASTVPALFAFIPPASSSTKKMKVLMKSERGCEVAASDESGN